MIQKEEDLTKLLSKIAEYDKDILYDTRLLRSYLLDMYTGRKPFLNVFLSYLSCLPNSKRELLLLTENQINSLCFPVISQEEQDIQRCTKILLVNIYVLKNYSLYNIFKGGGSQVEQLSHAKKITKFSANKYSMVSGDDLYLQWDVKKPYYLALSDGETSMDVTAMNSVTISAIKDVYVLNLFDKKHKVIDSKSIKLRLEEPAYCIYCGTRFIDRIDLFCCICGTKRV